MANWEHHNKNVVAAEIEKGKAEGRYKDCTKLSLSGGIGEWSSGFFVSCQEASLLRPEDPALGGIVRIALAREPRCPEDCRFFEDRARIEKERRAAEHRAIEEQKAAEHRANEEHARKERERKVAERWVFVRTVLFWPLKSAWGFLMWYAKAPWQTQVILAFALLLLLAPVYAKALADLLSAVLHGK